MIDLKRPETWDWYESKESGAVYTPANYYAEKSTALARLLSDHSDRGDLHSSGGYRVIDEEGNKQSQAIKISSKQVKQLLEKESIDLAQLAKGRARLVKVKYASRKDDTLTDDQRNALRIVAAIDWSPSTLFQWGVSTDYSQVKNESVDRFYKAFNLRKDKDTPTYYESIKIGLSSKRNGKFPVSKKWSGDVGSIIISQKDIMDIEKETGLKLGAMAYQAHPSLADRVMAKANSPSERSPRH